MLSTKRKAIVIAAVLWIVCVVAPVVVADLVGWL